LHSDTFYEWHWTPVLSKALFKHSQADPPFARYWLPATLALAAFAGCARETAVEFTSSEALSALPEKHQTQIKDVLANHYGSPADPRLMLPAAEDGASTADGSDVETPGEDAQSSEESTSEPKMVARFDAFHLLQGGRVYQRRCAPCHGVTGDGDGVAAEYLNPRPRDYRRGVFKFTSTPRGSKPRRADLERIIRWGAKGTSMPSFRWLPEDELRAVVDYVRMLSERGELESAMILDAQTELTEEDDVDPLYAADTAQFIDGTWNEADSQFVIPLTPPPPRDEETIELGRKAFLTRGCAKCHGVDGRGSTRDVGKDDWGHLAYAADITGGMLHGGHRSIDVYRRIFSGINGTPMPSFGDALKDEPDTIWHMVYYVQALANGRKFDNSDAAELEAQGQASQQPSGT
jgi:mono/diheme cytochrome c family protein